MYNLGYQDLILRINDGTIIPAGLWIEDENGIHWFFEDGNFKTGMKDWDKEPPTIYITDKYNLAELYEMKFKVVSLKDAKPEEYLSIKQIIEKFGSGNKNIGLLNKSTQEMWEFVPLKQDIINQDGESITEYIDNDKLDIPRFEILYQEQSLDKEEIRDNLEKAILDELTCIEDISKKAKEDIDYHLAHIKKLLELKQDMI